MLRIRLTRTGKKRQPSYRLVVAEHTSPIKGKFIEMVGHYRIEKANRKLVFNQDRIKYWISVGAKPSDTIASLLKKEGLEGMDRFILTKTHKRKKKKAGNEPAVTTTPSVKVAPESTPNDKPENNDEAAKNETSSEEKESPTKE
ncbi:MAG: 30S ribosomal protein S16, small subunit ribosomal protein S16 [Candidatus Peregrinibacteria bacterium GW2011_GWF2_39_17]|nr:MAG: 30S ribosomal protein S16, small subunit ribosomal protein S16 [Candidatus Peregrinibacteria bacterium GW2011_GWF2_39_17]HCW32228.1 30S ribosomal protein S16 [Candidatus Peregrinibacteria bacterium]